MGNKSKIFLTFALGALAGAAITALLTTEKGKKVLGKTKEGIDEFGNDLKGKLNDFENELSESLKRFKEKQNPQT